MDGVYLGIDLGGTEIKAARFSSGGEREAEERFGYDAGGEAEEIFGALLSAASNLTGDGRGGRLGGVGVAVAGVFDPEAGLIVDSPNIQALNGFELRSRVRDAFGDIPLSVMNDANAAALGEYFAGAGRGAASMCLLTLGTGIGSGFVLDGKIWQGTASVAAEAGHMCIRVDGPECHCGGRGCFEACVSGWALVRDAGEIARRHPGSAIAALAAITPAALSGLAAGGDEDALALWSEAGRMLGIGIANLMNLLNPECIVLVGGLAKAKEFFLEPARLAWEAQAFDRAHESTVVKLGTMGEWAGVRGVIQPLIEE